MVFNLEYLLGQSKIHPYNNNYLIIKPPGRRRPNIWDGMGQWESIYY